jgi:alkylation response protein AidB-like acyl-CoA dehydrogenase
VTAAVHERDRDIERAVVESARDAFADQVRFHDVLRSTGFAGLGVAEDLGGSGGSALHAGLVAEAAGEHAIAVGYLPQVLAAHAAAACGERELVERLVTGAGHGAVFFELVDGTVQPAPALPGQVPEQRIVALVRKNSCPVLMSSARVRADATTWLGPDWVDLVIEGEQPAHEQADRPWVAAVPLAHGLAAAAIVGLVRGLLAGTVEYVNQRRQFDRVIGSFQAIKHSLADVHIDVIHTAALVHGALDSLDRGDPDAIRLLALAKVAADRSAAGANRCLQAMGGIGFTWESSTHRYLKQALRLRQWPQPHRQLRAALRPQ